METKTNTDIEYLLRQELQRLRRAVDYIEGAKEACEKNDVLLSDMKDALDNGVSRVEGIQKSFEDDKAEFLSKFRVYIDGVRQRITESLEDKHNENERTLESVSKVKAVFDTENQKLVEELRLLKEEQLELGKGFLSLQKRYKKIMVISFSSIVLLFLVLLKHLL